MGIWDIYGMHHVIAMIGVAGILCDFPACEVHQPAKPWISSPWHILLHLAGGILNRLEFVLSQ
jgi:hypothetical protein